MREFYDEERDLRPGNDPTGYDRSGAEQSSRNCPHCFGGGWATVYAHDYQGDPIITEFWPDGAIKQRSARTVAYCICLMGRWLLINHQKTAPAVAARQPDLEEVLRGPSSWLASDPTEGMTDDQYRRMPKNFRELLARKLSVN